MTYTVIVLHMSHILCHLLLHWCPLSINTHVTSSKYWLQIRLKQNKPLHYKIANVTIGSMSQHLPTIWYCSQDVFTGCLQLDFTHWNLLCCSAGYVFILYKYLSEGCDEQWQRLSAVSECLSFHVWWLAGDKSFMSFKCFRDVNI